MKTHTAHRTWLAPILYMLLAMGMWAVIENIPGLLTQHYTTFEIVWMRYSVHLLFMLLIFGPRVKLRLVRTQRLGLQLVRGMLMLGMHLCFIFAVRFMSVDATMAGFWISPLLLIGLSALWGEKPDRIQWGVTLLCFGCVLVILRPLNGLQNSAALLSVGMALCFILYLQLSRVMTGEDILASLFYTAFSVWVILSVLMPFYWVTPNWRDMLLFAAIGLLGFVCIYGFDKAVESTPTWIAAPFTLSQPIFLIGFDFILRGNTHGKLSLAAAGLVITCFGFLAWRKSPLHIISGNNHV